MKREAPARAFAWLALMLLALAATPAPAEERRPFYAVSPDPGEVEAAIIDQTNAFRARNGLPSLRRNPILSREARAFAGFLTGPVALSHTADGSDAAGRAQAAGYGYCDLGENLAREEGASAPMDVGALAADFVQGWERSPGHRRNMLDATVVEIGVGVAAAPATPGRYAAVQVFGRPISMRVAIEVTNRADRALSYVFDGRRQRLEPGATVSQVSCAASSVAFEPDGPVFHPEDGATYVVTSVRPGRAAVQVERRVPGPSRCPPIS